MAIALRHLLNWVGPGSSSAGRRIHGRLLDLGHLQNLLLAARWTVALSLIAFVGGGIVGLALLVARIARLPGAEPLARGYVQLFQGTPLLMQLFLAYSAWAPGHQRLALGRRLARAHALCERLPHRDLARSVASVAKGQWEASSALALGLGEQLRQ